MLKVEEVMLPVSFCLWASWKNVLTLDIKRDVEKRNEGESHGPTVENLSP